MRDSFLVTCGDLRETVTARDVVAECARITDYTAASRADLWERGPRALTKAAELVLAEDSPMRSRLLDAGVQLGLSREMVAEGLRNQLGGSQMAELAALRAQLCAQSSSAEVLSPRLVFHVLAGNLFLSAMESMTMAVLSGAGSLVRCSFQDRLFPVLWMEALCEAEPLLRNALTVGYWPAEQRELTLAATTRADVTVAFGSDASVDAIRELVPVTRRFVAHGAKLSVAILSENDVRQNTGELAERLAYDFSIYDQQGCLSPRAAFVVGVPGEYLDRFGAELVSRMRELAVRLPGRKLDLSEQAALARARDEALIKQVTGGAAQVFSQMGDSFVATLQPADAYSPGCMNRFVDLRLCRTMEELLQVLSPFNGAVSTVGTSGAPQDFLEIARVLRAGRVCQIGEMQKPPPGWTHDGRFPLSDLLDVIGIED